MAKKQLAFTGIDIGSSKISAVTAVSDTDGAFRIESHATCESSGVTRGIISDLDKATGALSKAIGKLRQRGSRNLGEIYVNISGQDVKGAKSVGMIPISLRGREVTGADTEKSATAAGTIHLPFDREIIHKIVHSFSIDDQPWIKKPIGLYASRLSCEVYVVTANINHIQSIYKCVNDCGYDLKEVVFTGIADGCSLLDPEQRSAGAIVVNAGSSLSEISVFMDSAMESFEILPLGGGDVRGELRSSEVLEKLSSRISANIAEFSKRSGRVPEVVMTGGFALADGMLESVEERTGHKVRMGSSGGLEGDVSGLDNVRLTTAIGVARYACEKRAAEESGSRRRFSQKLVELFNNYF